MVTISRDDLLIPFSQFERKHNIKQVRDDIPRKFIGTSPSKYYHTVDMNIELAKGKVNKLFRKLYPR